MVHLRLRVSPRFVRDAKTRRTQRIQRRADRLVEEWIAGKVTFTADDYIARTYRPPRKYGDGQTSSPA